MQEFPRLPLLPLLLAIVVINAAPVQEDEPTVECSASKPCNTEAPTSKLSLVERLAVLERPSTDLEATGNPSAGLIKRPQYRWTLPMCPSGSYAVDACRNWHEPKGCDDVVSFLAFVNSLKEFAPQRQLRR